MVVFSSINAFDHNIFPYMVSSRKEMPNQQGFDGIDGEGSCLMPMFISKHNCHVALLKHNRDHALSKLAEMRN
jgi:hypothetical protein